MRDAAREHAEALELLRLREVERELLLDVPATGWAWSSLEARDLALLGLLRAEVGEGEAGQPVAVDLERRAPTSTGTSSRRRRRARARPWRWSPCRLRARRRSAGRPPATRKRVSGDPTIVSRRHDSSSASRRLAYRMSAARRHRRRAVAHVLDEHPVRPVGGREREHAPAAPPSETTNASTSPAPMARSVSSAAARRASVVGCVSAAPICRSASRRTSTTSR